MPELNGDLRHFTLDGCAHVCRNPTTSLFVFRWGAALQASTPATAVLEACQRLDVQGGTLRQQLARELPSKLLLRQRQDPLVLVGPPGSGKDRIAQLCTELMVDTEARPQSLQRVACQEVDADALHHRLQEQAPDGAVYLDDITALGPGAQGVLVSYLRTHEQSPRGPIPTVLLSSPRGLNRLTEDGKLREDLLDRLSNRLQLPPLHQRRKDIGELCQFFAHQAAQELDLSDFYGFTKRASAELETALVRAKETSVRRMRALVRDIVFCAAADASPEAIESDMVHPFLSEAFSYGPHDKQLQDVHELEHEFDAAVGSARLQELAERHGISPEALRRLCQVLEEIIGGINDRPRSYRNVVERTQKLTKVALWLVSGARSQAEFRRFFGDKAADMPTKSVAHQVFYEVFPKLRTVRDERHTSAASFSAALASSPKRGEP